MKKYFSAKLCLKFYKLETLLQKLFHIVKKDLPSIYNQSTNVAVPTVWPLEMDYPNGQICKMSMTHQAYEDYCED